MTSYSNVTKAELIDLLLERDQQITELIEEISNNSTGFNLMYDRANGEIDAGRAENARLISALNSVAALRFAKDVDTWKRAPDIAIAAVTGNELPEEVVIRPEGYVGDGRRCAQCLKAPFECACVPPVPEPPADETPETPEP